MGQQYVDNESQKMGKNILANWRGKPYLDMAQDKLNLPENGVKHLVEAIGQSNEFSEAISKSIERFGK